MEQFFGVITPAALIALITGLVQWVKNAFPKLTARQIQLVALGFAFIMMFPYSLVTANHPLIFADWFAALIYTLMGWLMTIGFYEVVLKAR